MPPTEVRGPAGGADRSWSIDLFRGVVMFLLVGEATGFYELLTGPGIRGAWLQALAGQFQHHPWHGLRLWDLGLPFFMFISGVAMVFSYQKRWSRGESWTNTFRHAAQRALMLFLLGWALAMINPVESGVGNEFLLDVLPQLAIAGLVGFLLLRRPVWVLVGAVLGLALTTELLYRLWAVPGFDQPFVAGHNFGSYLDMAIFGSLSEGNWVTFNIVPSTAFVLVGVFAGRLLRSGRAPSRIIRTLAVVGLLLALGGITLDPLTPIVRRICTTSFVLVGAGLGLLALAFAYGMVDLARIRKSFTFFVCVGMNPIFIYLFAYSGGAAWLQSVIDPFALGLSSWMGGLTARVLAAIVVWGLLWSLCRWLYEKKIFIRI